MWGWQLTNTMAAFLLPPGIIIAAIIVSLLLRPTHPRGSRLLLVGSIASLYILSMPLTANLLLRSWETPSVNITADAAQAIVVLGGGRYLQAPEYGGDTVSAATLLRLRYAAHLQKTTGLPVLVSGGRPDGGDVDEAQAMKKVMENEFSTPVQWMESGSGNTLQNAELSQRMLRSEGINTILLVTHAWHMPRAQQAFGRSGFRVIPAPTAYTTSGALTILDFLPDANALNRSSLFCHEVLGMIWYRLRLFLQN